MYFGESYRVDLIYSSQKFLFFVFSLNTFIHYLNISVVPAANYESLVYILKACH